MANRYFLTKTIIFSLVLTFLGGQVLFAQTSPVSEDVTINARVGEYIVVTPGGGGGGGNVLIPTTAVRFSGEAYPFAKVTLLKSGEEQTSVIADRLGRFSITFGEDYNNSILYSLYAEDVLGKRSILINYPIVVQVGFLTHLSGIRFAPTIVTDKVEVAFGDYLTLTGYALPKMAMEAVVQDTEEKIFSLLSSADGSYKIILPMAGLTKGDYVVYVRYINDNRISKLVKFTIGESNILKPDTALNIPGDCNADKIINLVDFSVLAFWYGKDNPPVCVDTNRDGKIDLTDFSILAFYWTG